MRLSKNGGRLSFAALLHVNVSFIKVVFLKFGRKHFLWRSMHPPVEEDPIALSQMQEYCLNKGIQFQGYLYKGYREVVWKDVLINFQAEYLLQHNEWLSDMTAANFLCS